MVHTSCSRLIVYWWLLTGCCGATECLRLNKLTGCFCVSFSSFPFLISCLSSSFTTNPPASSSSRSSSRSGGWLWIIDVCRFAWNRDVSINWKRSKPLCFSMFKVVQSFNGFLAWKWFPNRFTVVTVSPLNIKSLLGMNFEFARRDGSVSMIRGSQSWRLFKSLPLCNNLDIKSSKFLKKSHPTLFHVSGRGQQLWKVNGSAFNSRWKFSSSDTFFLKNIIFNTVYIL